MGELIKWLEKKGWRNQYYDNVSRDVVDETMKNIPLIIFSSLINDEIRRKGESLGADAQLTKPEIGKLIAVVDDLVAKYEDARKANS